MTIIQRRQLAILIPLGASIVVASLWGGMLYDRVLLDPENTGFLNLLGFPLPPSLPFSGCLSLWIDS